MTCSPPYSEMGTKTGISLERKKKLLKSLVGSTQMNILQKDYLQSSSCKLQKSTDPVMLEPLLTGLSLEEVLPVTQQLSGISLKQP